MQRELRDASGLPVLVARYDNGALLAAMQQHTQCKELPHLSEAYIHKSLRDMQALRILDPPPPAANGSAHKRLGVHHR